MQDALYGTTCGTLCMGQHAGRTVRDDMEDALVFVSSPPQKKRSRKQTSSEKMSVDMRDMFRQVDMDSEVREKLWLLKQREYVEREGFTDPILISVSSPDVDKIDSLVIVQMSPPAVGIVYSFNRSVYRSGNEMTMADFLSCSHGGGGGDKVAQENGTSCLRDLERNSAQKINHAAATESRRHGQTAGLRIYLPPGCVIGYHTMETFPAERTFDLEEEGPVPQPQPQQ
ncbi:hypothetical protein F2P81_001114 [Scophthalmus maximus]|uniref:Uncharacterized protein n=1 Tax=Scophthalmus maximus TaxID=52904 RepID=A0A6A4TYB3_SCOMX|nr:hypothetical protein F2P81_001114 [Scophthalmus maximus]